MQKRLDVERGRSWWIAGTILVVMACLCPRVQADIIQDITAAPAEIRPGESLTVRFRLAQPAHVKLTILDSDLDAVRTYDAGDLPAGTRQIAWDGRDESGQPVASEVYSWRIETSTRAGTDVWEPAWLRSRPVEHIAQVDWDLPTRTFSYRTPAPMRIWVRISISNGACLRLLAEGEPRPQGVMAEIWDGLDETGTVDFMDRKDWVVSAFGYRLPYPCVLVVGSERKPQAGGTGSFETTPPLKQNDPWWTRRRAFALSDRLRPRMRLEQLDGWTFAASLAAPDEAGPKAPIALQRILQDRFRLKWFIDGHCAGEEVDAALPSLMTFDPDQIPKDGEHHFVTVNLLSATQQACVASMWIHSEEESK